MTSNNVFKLTNSILKICFFIVFKFFTSWILILHFLYYLDIIKNYQYSLLMLSSIVSIGGFFITYIYPRYVIIPETSIKIDGIILKIIDILCHHIPLILLLYFYNNKIKKDNLIFGLLVIIIYLIINNPIKIYSFI